MRDLNARGVSEVLPETMSAKTQKPKNGVKNAGERADEQASGSCMENAKLVGRQGEDEGGNGTVKRGERECEGGRDAATRRR